MTSQSTDMLRNRVVMAGSDCVTDGDGFRASMTQLNQIATNPLSQLSLLYHMIGVIAVHSWERPLHLTKYHLSDLLSCVSTYIDFSLDLLTCVSCRQPIEVLFIIDEQG